LFPISEVHKPAALHNLVLIHKIPLSSLNVQ
jgi:hypothetical protein